MFRSGVQYCDLLEPSSLGSSVDQIITPLRVYKIAANKPSLTFFARRRFTPSFSFLFFGFGCFLSFLSSLSLYLFFLPFLLLLPFSGVGGGRRYTVDGMITMQKLCIAESLNCLNA